MWHVGSHQASALWAARSALRSPTAVGALRRTRQEPLLLSHHARYQVHDFPLLPLGSKAKQGCESRAEERQKPALATRGFLLLSPLCSPFAHSIVISFSSPHSTTHWQGEGALRDERKRVLKADAIHPGQPLHSHASPSRRRDQQRPELN